MLVSIPGRLALGIFMMRCPIIQVKTVERNPARSDLNLGHVRTHILVELIAAHAQVGRCVAVVDEAGEDHLFAESIR